MHPSTRRLGALALVIAAVLVAGTVAIAQDGVSRGQASTLDHVKAAGTDDASFQFTGGDGSLRNVPAARHRLILTRETLVVARFAAAMFCQGGPGRCEAPIFVLDTQSRSTVRELTGVRVLERAPSDGHETRAVEQSATLPPGDYLFQVRMELAVESGGQPITAQIAQWHFTVEAFV